MKLYARPGLPVAAVILAVSLGVSGCAGVRTPSDVPLAFANAFKRSKPAAESVTQAQFGQVRVGMTRLRVKSLLGEPLVSSPSQSEAWDYVVRMDDGSAPPARYQAWRLAFERDRVSAITALVP